MASPRSGLFALALVLAFSVTAGARAQDVTLAQRYAPLVVLHPDDQHRPSSVEWFIERSTLRDASGAVVDARPTPNTLPWARTDLYLDASESAYSGMPLRDIGGGNARVDAPMYVRTKRGPNFIDLTYAFFYPFNGCQMFRVGLYKFFSKKARNFPWCDFARHQGDWEHVTVRVTADGSRVVSLYLAQHGEGEWRAANQVAYSGTHPIIFSALHSHASYASEGTFTEAEIDAARVWTALVSPIRWLNVIDTTSRSELVVYAPQPQNRVEWRAWENPTQLVALEGPAWVGFLGTWGGAMDNGNLKKPPSMWANADVFLYALGKIANFVGAIPARYKDGGGPSGPMRKDWWNGFEGRPTEPSL